MKKLPFLHYIDEIKTKLGFSRTLTAPGQDVVDATNKLSGQISDLDTVNTLGVSEITMATGAIEGTDIGSKNNHVVNLVFRTTAISISNNGDIIGTLSNNIKPSHAFFTPVINWANGGLLGSFLLLKQV